MKSPSYILAVILSLTANIALATPVADADPDFEALEERAGVTTKTVAAPDLYPGGSSRKTGSSRAGATFSPTCKYQTKDSEMWFSTSKGWVKDSDKSRNCRT
ncbi:hypothetical protein N7457_007929 [Penicillium paradoxum]|uniref:uncharacterized protein n=1 Tax=Penicillium paradoxum TaxID=176176 RepID=UPI0025473B01|nr:uncharacterized protein N7457_007929 [Penicillium paradoxum]KAJ5773033.1 hypothetical protein N7457_007929 [Penicillium paradoxum]